MDPDDVIRRARRLGILVVLTIAVSFVILSTFKLGGDIGTDKAILYTDFKTVTGLRQGSPVQLAGVEVGRVRNVDFVEVKYDCNPLTEDLGRFWAGRTDDCDEDLFCAPAGLCAELEPYAGKAHHPRCDSTQECAATEVCITTELRNRQSHVEWAGPHGVCATVQTTMWRTRVEMEIPEEQFPMVRVDSRANVAANSVLGDQLVNISPGRGEALTGRMRLHTRSSLNEDIDKLRRRVVSFLEKADVSLVALNSVLDELRDEPTINALKGIAFNLQVITRDAAFGDGLIGGLLNSPAYRDDVGATFAALHQTARGLDRATNTSNAIMSTAEHSIEPLLTEAGATLQAADQLLVDLEDPTNKSVIAKLVRDPDGNLARDLDLAFGNVAEVSGSAVAIVQAIERGDGTIGSLINEDQLGQDIGRLLHNLARHGVVRTLALYYLRTKDIADVNASRDSARPRKVPGRR